MKDPTRVTGIRLPVRDRKVDEPSEDSEDIEEITDPDLLQKMNEFIE